MLSDYSVESLCQKILSLNLADLNIPFSVYLQVYSLLATAHF